MTILAAVNDEKTVDPVVEIATDLATAFGEKLLVLHVLPRKIYEKRSESRPDYYADVATDEAADVAREVAEVTLDETSNVEYRGIIGDPSTKIVEQSADAEVNYTVIGGRQRTPTGKVIFGSVTQSVLLNAKSPVVTVMDS